MAPLVNAKEAHVQEQRPLDQMRVSDHCRVCRHLGEFLVSGLLLDTRHSYKAVCRHYTRFVEIRNGGIAQVSTATPAGEPTDATESRTAKAPQD